MIKKYPYFIGSIVGGLLAIVISANTQTLGPVPFTGSIGNGTSTSLAINGCTLGTDVLCVNGSSTFVGVTTLNGLTLATLNLNLNNAILNWSNADLFSPSPNTLQIGLPDSSSAASQTFQTQSLATGASNSSAANLTMTNNAARGTGTGMGGAWVIQTAPPGLSSTNQNPLVPAFVVDGASHLRIGSMTAPSISSCGGGSPSVSGTDQGGTITFGTTATTCTLTWTNAYNGNPVCIVAWQNNLAAMQFTPSNTNLLLSQTSTSGNKAHYICFGNKGG